MERAIINMETGEVQNIAKEGDRVQVIRKESLDLLSTRATWDTGGFFKGYIAELRHILPKLTQGEKALLMALSPYVSYIDCHLQYSNGRDIGLNEIVRISGYTNKTVIKLLAGLVDKDILYRGKNSTNSQWFVNPWLFSRGNTINKVLKAMFKNYYIQSERCKWKDLGDF